MEGSEISRNRSALPLLYAFSLVGVFASGWTLRGAFPPETLERKVTVVSTFEQPWLERGWSEQPEQVTPSTSSNVSASALPPLEGKGEPSNAPSLTPGKVEESTDSSALIPTKYEILPPEDMESHIIINGKAYSLELLDDSGNPNLYAENTQLSRAAMELKDALPLPKPILVVGMPKAGTSSITEFFQNSGSRTVHWKITNATKTAFPEYSGRYDYLVGFCMRKAFNKNIPLLKSCGDYEVWAQMDVTNPKQPQRGCTYPQITYLEELHNEAPNATFILNRRDFTSWADSMHRWTKMGGALDERAARCKPFGPKSAKAEDLISWHKEHITRIRKFVMEHPSHALIEVDIQDADAGVRLSKVFQIDQSYWGQANVNLEKPAPGTKGKKVSAAKPSGTRPLKRPLSKAPASQSSLSKYAQSQRPEGI